MNKCLATLIVVAVMSSTPSAAAVRNLTIKDKPMVELDTSRAYILVESNQAMPLFFFRVADDAAKSAYESEKAEAYLKARADYEKKLVKYEKRHAAWMKSGQKTGKTEPVKPDEVTEETFRYLDIEQTNMFMVGPLNRFAKGEKSLHLHEVDPGEYVFYSSGACMCMGTVKFVAKPGVITVMGRVGISGDEYKALPPRERAEGESMALPPIGHEGLQVTPATPDVLDPRLAGYKHVAAELAPVGWLPNWSGGAINRVNPIPGILEYNRGEVVGL